MTVPVVVAIAVSMAVVVVALVAVVASVVITRSVASDAIGGVLVASAQDKMTSGLRVAKVDAPRPGRAAEDAECKNDDGKSSHASPP